MAKALPINFNPYGPPTFYGKAPVQNEVILTQEKSEEIYSGHVLEETDTHRRVIEVDHDYGGCYYESDSRSIECKIVTYRKDHVPNAQYEKALAKFEKEKATYDKQVAQWQEHKKMYAAKQREKAAKAKKTREANEKALYLKLKEKFEIDNKQDTKKQDTKKQGPFDIRIR
jgi:hypothetical protein